MRLRLATESRSTIVELMNSYIKTTAAYGTKTPEQAGSYIYEPFGAQFTFSNLRPLTDTFELAISGPGKDVLDTIDGIQNFLEKIRLFNASDLAAESCWLEWSATGESEKRTLLYSGALSVQSEGDITPMLEKCSVVGTLSLSRHPLWENTTTKSVSVGVSVSALGGALFPTNITGNVPARLSEFRLLSTDPGIGLDRAWVGIRRENQGVANFEPLWECEDGTPNAGNGAAVVADVTASPGGLGNNKVAVTYAGVETLLERLTITVAQICAAAGHVDYDQQQGRYLVLCRCKVSAAGTSGIQMRSGYTGNVYADEVYVDNTVWRLIPLGHISIPPWEGAQYGGDAFMYNYRLDIYSEQLTTGHDLELDCLILIPNGHMITLDGCNIQNNTGDYVITHEDDTEVAYEYDAVNLRVSDAIEYGSTDWYLPPGDSVMVFAAEDDTTPDIADTVTAVIPYYPRWMLYRSS